jgi:hypothetical protein
MKAETKNRIKMLESWANTCWGLTGNSLPGVPDVWEVEALRTGQEIKKLKADPK